MIELKSIRKAYQTGSQSLTVLKGIDCTIEEGELVAIMGSSGSGKSTLLNVLGLLDDFDEGSYVLNGQNMDGLSEKAAARYRSDFLGFVFQSFNLISYKTALENVALPLYYQGVPRKERQARALSFLTKVGLADWAEHLPNQMSGGQKQRVAIARALIGNPSVILADEPTGALDSVTSDEVMALLKEINSEGITIVVVTHENEIANQCDRIIRLKDGRIEGANA
ncbi:MAG: ABC transporter ATP-binding protein [Crocinitomicaceae bacterium TMED209]|nr:MAG: ABC transporter ATP-binding protein [Crocinitomicaceae bacterium TMED209]